MDQWKNGAVFWESMMVARQRQKKPYQKQVRCMFIAMIEPRRFKIGKRKRRH